METEIMIPDELAPVVKQSGLEKAEQYAATFAPFMITLKELSDKASGITHDNPSPVDAKLAREIRLAMVKNRTATAKKKDECKATILAEGNLIQNLHNVVVNASVLSEADLEAVEKFAENKEKERQAALQAERVEALLPYAENASDMPLSSMTDDQFKTMLEGYKLQHDQRIEREKKEEADRLAKIEADRIEQERIRQENEHLKAEAEKAVSALEVERKAAEDKLKAERDEAARVAKIEADKQSAILKEQQDKAKAAEAEAARLRKLEDDRKAAEAKAKADQIAAEKKAAKAPVKEKLKVAITGLQLNLPDSDITVDLMAKFNGYKTWALSQIESL